MAKTQPQLQPQDNAADLLKGLTPDEIKDLLKLREERKVEERKQARQTVLSMLSKRSTLRTILIFLTALPAETLDLEPAESEETIEAPTVLKEPKGEAHKPKAPKVPEKLLERAEALKVVEAALLTTDGIRAIDFVAKTGLNAGEFGWYVNEIHKVYSNKGYILKAQGEKRAKAFKLVLKEAVAS